ncbi:MAG: hypothetical protein LUD72_03295 [Bacteroidales bacterium]|nr:hypothetical protein [Bacteroidales bacterium]
MKHLVFLFAFAAIATMMACGNGNTVAESEETDTLYDDSVTVDTVGIDTLEVDTVELMSDHLL